VSIFDVMSTLYTAVTFHELYKAAAIHGNTKMEFGLSFRSLSQELGASLFNLEDPSSIDVEAIRQKFHEVDTDGSGSLDADEIMQIFTRLGKTPKKSTIANLIRVCDTDQNGTIDWCEFRKIFVLLKAVSVNEDEGEELVSPSTGTEAPKIEEKPGCPKLIDGLKLVDSPAVGA